MNTANSRTHVFISYSHKDKDWLERLRVHLRPLERQLPQLEIWDDTMIKVGAQWRTEITAVIARTKVAILLVTADFLASDFIATNELPPLLKAAESGGAKILPIIVSPSRFERMPSLSQFQSVNDPSKPLVDMPKGKRAAILVKVADAIEDLLLTSQGSSDPIPFAEPAVESSATPGVPAHSIFTRDQASNNYLDILKREPTEWNRWRKHNPEIRIELAGLKLIDLNLSGINLSSANLSGAILDGSNLSSANLRNANLEGASLMETDFTEADLSQAVLRRANLSGASLAAATLARCDLADAILRRVDMSDADLTAARLTDADLQRAMLVGTIFTDADLSGCLVYGISAWNLSLDRALQSDLAITLPDEPTITVDNIEVAQLLYLLLSNEKIRDVIDAVSAKNVLILGRFGAERKLVVDAIRDELRRYNYLPIVFDFSKPRSRNITDTLVTLAAMARFVIADITDATIAQELSAITSAVVLPIAPILEESSTPFAMMEDIVRRFPWVLKPIFYNKTQDLSDLLSKAVIAPAEAEASELAARKREIGQSRL